MTPGQFPAERWTREHAAHLLNRAGFGGEPGQVERLFARGMEGAVDALLRGGEDDDLYPPPEGVTEAVDLLAERKRLRGMSEDDRAKAIREARMRQQQQMRELQSWWMQRMHGTPHPLREKMTLFWHGHFATSSEKVRAPMFLWQQNETFRAYALGNFRELTKEISRDPAMMRYLDLVDSKRAKPNENFARELMELFTLGEGVCYSEKDISEAARAFTGYRINAQTGGFRAVEAEFDPTEKTFLGKTGPLTGDEVIDRILEQPEASEFLVRKLWVYFVSDTPDPSWITPLAAEFRQRDYEVAPVLRRIFLSSAFYSPEVMRAQIKSPIQWLVQMARSLGAPLPPQPAVNVALTQLAQVPFAPPSVKGWEPGRAWICSSSMVFRSNFAGYFACGITDALDGRIRQAGAPQLDLAKIAPASLRESPDDLVEALIFRVFGGEIDADLRARLLSFARDCGSPVSDDGVRKLLHQMMSSPEYQLT